MKFAKLFDLDNDIQVLVVLEYNDNKDLHCLAITTEINDTIMKTTVDFNNEKQAKKAFDTYTLNQATSYYTKMNRLISDK